MDLARSQFVAPFQIAWRASKQGDNLFNNDTPSQGTKNLCWKTGRENAFGHISKNI